MDLRVVRVDLLDGFMLLVPVFGGRARLRFGALSTVAFVFALIVGPARRRFFSGEIALMSWDRIFPRNFMFLLRSRVCCALSCLVIFDASETEPFRHIRTGSYQAGEKLQIARLIRAGGIVRVWVAQFSVLGCRLFRICGWEDAE